MRTAVCVVLVVAALLGSAVAVGGPLFSSDPKPGSTVSLPETYLNTKSAAGKITVTNGGNETLVLSGWNVPDHFSTDANGKVSVNANKSYTIEVYCTPVENGTTTSTFSFSTNDNATATASYKLSCEVEDAPAVFSRPAPYSTISFGNNAPKSTAKAHATMMNKGGGELKVLDHTFTNENVDGKAVSGQFTVSGLPDTLAPGEEQRIDFECNTPSSPGLLFTTLVISTNDPVNPDLQFDLACLSISWGKEALGLVYLLVFWVVVGAGVAAVFWFMPK